MRTLGPTPLLAAYLLLALAAAPVSADDVFDAWRHDLDTRRMTILERADWFERRVRAGKDGATVEALKRFVEDPLLPRDVYERASAALALARIDSRHLTTSLESPYHVVTWIASVAMVGRITDSYIPADLTEYVDPERFRAHDFSVVDSVEAFFEGLARDDARDRAFCLAVLRAYRPRGGSVYLQLRTGQLLEGLTDESALVRYGAALGLRGRVFRRLRKEVTDGLVRAAVDPDARVRRAAMEALAHRGWREWSKARAAIVHGLADRDPLVVSAAADALIWARSRERDVYDTVEAVLAALDRSRAPAARANLLHAAAVIGAEGGHPFESACAERVCTALRDPSAVVRHYAACSAGHICASPVRAATALLAVTRDPVAAIRARALRSLQALNLPVPAVAEAAVRSAGDRSPRVRSAAVLLLMTQAPLGRAWIARILGAMLRDPCWHVRLGALTALNKLGPEAAACLPELIDLLGSEHVPWTLRPLIRRSGAAAVPFLAERLADATPALRSDLTDLLGSIGMPALPVLVPLLGSKRAELRAAALAGLARMGPAARSADGELIRAASGGPDAHGALAAWALYRAGQQTAPSDALRAAAGKSTWCAWALAQIARDTPAACARRADDLARLRGHELRAVGDAAADALAELGVLPPSETDRFAGPALPETALVTHLKMAKGDRRRRALARTLRTRAAAKGHGARRPVREAYGVEIETPRPPRGWIPIPEVGGTGTPLHDRALGAAAERRILAALAHYPPRLIRARLARVVLVASLLVSGTSYGGTYRDKTIYLAVGSRVGLDLERMFHHELSSLLWNKEQFPRGAWSKALPPGRAYGRGGREAIFAGRTGGVSPDLFRAGFFKPYAASDLENDFNVFTEMVMTYPGWARAVAARHPRLAAKWRVWCTYLKSLDESFAPPAPPTRP